MSCKLQLDVCYCTSYWWRPPVNATKEIGQAWCICRRPMPARFETIRSIKALYKYSFLSFYLLWLHPISNNDFPSAHNRYIQVLTINRCRFLHCMLQFGLIEKQSVPRSLQCVYYGDQSSIYLYSRCSRVVGDWWKHERTCFDDENIDGRTTSCVHTDIRPTRRQSVSSRGFLYHGERRLVYVRCAAQC